ncbi:MAG: hypothetical protein CMJ34_03210 [Phycisphaerae bacterium]|nr:hypothetical protein [Phycisphaerae bacterium]
MNSNPMEESREPNAVDPLSDSLRWVLALGADPSRSPIDWLALELDPDARNAADAICRSVPGADADLDRLELLKSGFKSMRMSGENASDRRVAARYYAATIAAGVVRHRVWITEQRPERVTTAIEDLQQDDSMPESLRDLAKDAIETIDGEIIRRRPRN